MPQKWREDESLLAGKGKAIAVASQDETGPAADGVCSK